MGRLPPTHVGKNSRTAVISVICMTIILMISVILTIIMLMIRDAEHPFSFHPAAFASYQNSLKVKKKKVPAAIKMPDNDETIMIDMLWHFLTVRTL